MPSNSVDPPSSQNQEAAELMQEWQAFRDAIADAVVIWAGIETSLADLLRVAMGPCSDGLAETIYFTPVNTETRIEIVSNVIARVVSGIMREASDAKRMLGCWSKIHLHLSRARKKRNKVAHGTITVVHKGNGARARFTGPLLDTVRSFSEEFPLGQGAQLPGMSVHDIRRVTLGFVRCRGHIMAFTETVNLIRHDGALDTLRDKLRALEDGLKLGLDHHGDGQTGQEPLGQP